MRLCSVTLQNPYTANHFTNQYNLILRKTFLCPFYREQKHLSQVHPFTHSTHQSIIALFTINRIPRYYISMYVCMFVGYVHRQIYYMHILKGGIYICLHRKLQICCQPFIHQSISLDMYFFLTISMSIYNLKSPTIPFILIYFLIH